MKNQPFLKIILACYFAANLLVRWEIVFSVNQWLTLVVGAASCLLFFSIAAFPRYLKYSLWAFAFTFPLYGAISALYTTVHVFEFLLSAQSLALLVVSMRRNLSLFKSKVITWLLLLYFFYSFISILLFPTFEYLMLLNPDRFVDGWIHMLYSNNWTPLYSIAGINRLGLFITSAMLISCQDNARILFKGIFISMISAGVISAVIGILNQFGVPYLGFSTGRHQGRLQSVFSHTNCFSMYMVITCPFIFYGFLQGNLRRRWKVALYVVIVVCVAALVFSASRASWLLYPLTLFVGGLCVYWQKNGSLKWKIDQRLSIKGMILFSLTLLICILFIYSFATQNNIREYNDVGSSQSKRVSTSLIKKRLAEIMRPTVRARIVHDTLFVIKEAPIFGLGFESYGWHTSILSQIPQSDFSQNRNEPRLWGAPHNLYLTHLVNGGIVGLVLWLTLIGVVCSLLISDLLANKGTDAIPVLLSIFVFHFYGMVESMQFAPIIWFSILLCIAYATTIDESVLPVRLTLFLRKWSIVCGVLVLSGGVAYAANFQSWRLAEKYGLPRYYAPNNLDQIYYSGFYTPTTKPPIGTIRWMGKRGSIEIVDDGVMEFNIVCEHLDIQEEPVIVTIDFDGKVIDEIVFPVKGIKKQKYSFPESAVGKKLNITVSRTWNPKKFGARWGRILGVAVSPPQYL